jgi:glycosyltransferase involved in cell wall biosynthesis
MKILHVIPNLVKGGAQRIAIDICQELSKRADIEVMLVYFEGENEFSFLTEGLRVRKLDIHFKLSFTSKNTIDLSSFESLLDEFQPNIIHSHLYLAEVITREKTRPNIQYFTHCHDNMRQFRKFSSISSKSKTDLIEYLEKKRLFKRYKNCHNNFLAISKDGLNFLNKNIPNKLKEKAILLPNAIALSNFKSKEKHFISEQIRLVNIGNFIPKKNQQFLIDIAVSLVQKNINFHLTFVGDGEMRKSAEEKAKKLGVDHLVTFLGSIDDVEKVLSRNDIYVHSALYEAFGLVIIEAMSAGLPVVSLDGKGNKDLIQNDENGYLLEQGDTNQFVTRILELANNHENYTRIQQKGFETARSYDIVPYCDCLLEIYTNSKN